jgi:hypothetical protein
MKALKTKIAFFLICLFISLFIVAETAAVEFQIQYTPPKRVTFWVDFEQPNLETGKINTQIRTTISGVTTNETIGVSISNGYKINDHIFGYAEYIGLLINQTGNATYGGITYFEHDITHTVELDIFGAPALYPFDSYFLNLTFTFSGYGELNDTAIIKVYPEMLQLTGWTAKKFNDTTVEYNEHLDTLSVNQGIIISRAAWSTLPMVLFLTLGYLLLGSTVVIESLSTKATIFTAMFVFFAGLYFSLSANIPKTYGLSMGELLILILIIGTALFLFFGIIQYAAKRRSKMTPNKLLWVNHLIMLFPIGLISIYLYLILMDTINIMQFFFWVSVPTEFWMEILFLILPWLAVFLGMCLKEYLNYRWKNWKSKDVALDY